MSLGDQQTLDIADGVMADYVKIECTLPIEVGKMAHECERIMISPSGDNDINGQHGYSNETREIKSHEGVIESRT